MVWRLSKYLLFTFTFFSFLGVYKTKYQDEVNYLNRCSQFFKNQRIISYPKGRIHLSKVKNGLLTGQGACRSMIMGSFLVIESFDSVAIKIRDEDIYKNLLNVFVEYFGEKDFRDDNKINGNYLVYDLNEPAKLFVFNTILEEPVHKLFQGTDQVLSGGEKIILRTKLKYMGLNIDEKNKENVFNHFGGGILGHSIYLLQNLKLENNEIQTEAFSTRKYPISIFKDFLCRDLPVLKMDDIYPFVFPEHELSIKNMPSCVHCHATMDPITNVVNTIYEKEVIVSGKEKLLLAARAPASNIPKETLWHDKQKTGYLRYRDLKGNYKNLFIKDLEDLGAAISDQDDFYSCMSKKISYELGNEPSKEVSESVLSSFKSDKTLINLILKLI